MKYPTQYDLAWALGYLDGEAHIFLYTRRCGRIDVKSTHPGSLGRLSRLFGGPVRYVSKSKTQKNYQVHKPMYRWYINGDLARECAIQLLDLMEPAVKTAELQAVRWASVFDRGTTYGDFIRERANKHRNHRYEPPFDN